MHKFSKAISVSFIIHLTILVMIIGGAIFLRSDSGGSGGSDGAIVSVWLAGPGGQIISGPPRVNRQKPIKSSEIKQAHRKSKIGKETEETRRNSGAMGIGKSAGKGAGIGSSTGKAVGSGSGEGIGEGNGLMR